jgi:hypothetical protein
MNSIWLFVTALPDRWYARRQARKTLSTPAAQAVRPPWLGDPRRCVTADCLLLGLAIATAAVCLVGTTGPARPLLVLASACLVPGAAALTRLPVKDHLEALVLAVSLGFSIEIVGALAMVWTGWWHPVGWALVVLITACIVLALDLRRNVATMRAYPGANRPPDSTHMPTTAQ